MKNDLDQVEQDARARMMDRMALGVRIGLEALSMRLLMVIALVANAGISAWCMYNPSWERLAAAVVFALFSYFLIHVKPKVGD